MVYGCKFPTETCFCRDSCQWQARSVEVSENGACAVRNCRVTQSRIGVQLRGPVAMDSTEILETSLQDNKEIRTIPNTDCVDWLLLI